jgi:hypothetical protein
LCPERFSIGQKIFSNLRMISLFISHEAGFKYGKGRLFRSAIGRLGILVPSSFPLPRQGWPNYLIYAHSRLPNRSNWQKIHRYQLSDHHHRRGFDGQGHVRWGGRGAGGGRVPVALKHPSQIATAGRPSDGRWA